MPSIAEKYNHESLSSFLDSPSYDWCAEAGNKKGIIYSKMPKAASSTIAGIVTRIRLAYEKQSGKTCSSHTTHLPIFEVAKRYPTRDRGNTFFFSSVRDPASRAISRIYYDRHFALRSPERFVEVLKTYTNSEYGVVSRGRGGFQVPYLALTTPKKDSFWNETHPNQVMDPASIHEVVGNIIQDYDFVVLTKRLDESLVILQLLLGMETKDILYNSSKEGGMFHMKHKKGKPRCFKTIKHPEKLWDEVEDHLKSAQWYSQSYGDYVLVEAVNQSIDLTIEAIGRERFELALDKYKEMKKLVDK
mmetsp:Transcript_26765/g.31137  ORF Transcript_26765/g.31137 Transcript_26765/m.31137 type:complete len:303 (+) Transcript_26765:379-1287(+)